MEQLPITLAILTWKSPVTLKRTLDSLKPINNFFQERLVICQESDAEEIAIVESCGFTPIKLKNNVGIQKGLVECARHSRHESVLIMENDIPWIVDPERAQDFYNDCKLYLASGLKMCRLDNFPDPPRKRYVRFWGAEFPVSRTFSGLVRWREANAIRAEIVGFKRFNHDSSMNSFMRKASDTFHITDSSAIYWNNHSILINKDFFLNTVIAYAESANPRRSFNEQPELESTLNCPRNRSWWRGKKFKIGISAPGYFGHVRYDRAENDEKSVAGGSCG